MPGFKDQLAYDNTDADTLAASDQVGAIVKSGDVEITKSGALCNAKTAKDFVDGDVTVGTDAIAETDHAFNTGDKVQLTSSGTLPAGLALVTDYYIIFVDKDNFKFAASFADAHAGTAVVITAAAGGGTHTVTHFAEERQALDVAVCTPIEVTVGGIFDEDSAHSSGHSGSHQLSVRQDTLAASTDADGDYASLKSNSVGELYTTDEGAEALLTTIDADTGVIAGDTTSIDATLTALSKAEDSVHVSGDQGIMGLAVRNDAGSALAADGDYIPITTDSTGALRVTTAGGGAANKNEDDPFSSGDTGNYVLAVRQDTLAADTSADGDYASFKVNAAGELYTTDEAAEALLTTIDADTGSILTEIQSLTHAEDAAHVSGDVGTMGLAVRNDTLASLVDTDGDYAPMQVDADGALYVTLNGEALDDMALANTAIAHAQNDVGTSAESAVAAALSNRKYLFIQNLSGKTGYIGGAGVTTANGFKIGNNVTIELRAGASVDVQAISTAAASDFRTLELS
jgi:hypothetical protein